ncbi:MAG: type II toxin-antitoxin system VapC family toxin [Candidatus Bathyarchaeia archaeon]|jgi:predicted nucleic acid-binding protein
METVKTIIDTDLLIDLLRSQRQATAFIASLEEKNYVLATTAINLFELHHGAHKSQESEKNLQAINKLVNRLSILSLSSKAAQKAGHIYAQLERDGQPIGLRDTFIAAIALTREYSVATRNQAHFSRISGLSIITP